MKLIDADAFKQNLDKYLQAVNTIQPIKEGEQCYVTIEQVKKWLDDEAGNCVEVDL